MAKSVLTIQDAAVHNNKVFVAFSEALYMVSTDLAIDGEYRSGRITFGVYEPKTPTQLELVIDQVPVGASIVASLFDDAGVEHAITTIDEDSAKRTTVTIPDTVPVSEWYELKLVFNRGTDTDAEVSLERWTMRALVLPGTGEGAAAVGSEDEFIVPIVLADAVRDTARGTVHKMDPYAEWRYLEGLKRSGAVVTLQFGEHTEQARLADLALDEGQRSELWRWSGSQASRWVEGIWLSRWIRVPTPLPPR